MSTRRKLLYVARTVALALFGAAMLVLGTATAAETKPGRRIYISTFADSILREGYDTATVENGFCIVTRSKGRDYFVDSAFQAIVIEQSIVNVSFICPEGTGDAHYHLNLDGYDLYNPSPSDMLTTLCAKPRPDFNMIVAPKFYVAYGFKDEVKAPVNCR